MDGQPFGTCFLSKAILNINFQSCEHYLMASAGILTLKTNFFSKDTKVYLKGNNVPGTMLHEPFKKQLWVYTHMHGNKVSGTHFHPGLYVLTWFSASKSGLKFLRESDALWRHLFGGKASYQILLQILTFSIPCSFLLDNDKALMQCI